MITREIKQKQIKFLSDSMQKSKASFLVDFKGLSVPEITELRKELRTNNLADMKVCRNTLIQKSLDLYPEAKKHLSSYLKGSNAIVFSYDNPSEVAKILCKYANKTEALNIKIGVLGKDSINVADIKALATLPSIEVLKAQLLGVLSAPMSKLLAVFSAAPQGIVRALSEYKDKKENEEKNKKEIKQ